MQKQDNTFTYKKLAEYIEVSVPTLHNWRKGVDVKFITQGENESLKKIFELLKIGFIVKEKNRLSEIASCEKCYYFKGRGKKESIMCGKYGIINASEGLDNTFSCGKFKEA